MREQLHSTATSTSRRLFGAVRLHAILALTLLAVTGSPTAGFAADGETDKWFVIRFNGNPVGHERIRMQEIEFEGVPILSCHRKTQINFKRLGHDLTVRASLWTRQGDDGTLLYFKLQRIDGAGARLERTGTWNSDRNFFHVNERVSATRREFDLRTPGPVKSPLVSTWLPATMQNLRNGSAIPVLFPESANVVRITATRHLNKYVRIDNRKRIDATQFVYAPQLEPAKRTTLFVDSGNALLRSEQGILGGTLEVETATTENALRATSGKSLNIDLLTPVPTTRLLTTSPMRERLVIELSVTDGFLPEIPTTAFQTVERLSDLSAKLTLTKPDLKRRRAVPASYVENSARVSTRLMPLNDVRLQRMAATGAAGATNPAEVCQRLERMVQSKMQRSAFSTSIVPADEVAKRLRGDCTEHAVLLAALMRIKGIPSRVASGLVHTNQQFGFVAHTWVEALIEDQWLPFDSSAATGTTELTHIKLAHSELSDPAASGITLFLPILDIAGHAQVAIISEK